MPLAAFRPRRLRRRLLLHNACFLRRERRMDTLCIRALRQLQRRTINHGDAPKATGSTDRQRGRGRSRAASPARVAAPAAARACAAAAPADVPQQAPSSPPPGAALAIASARPAALVPGHRTWEQVREHLRGQRPDKPVTVLTLGTAFYQVGVWCVCCWGVWQEGGGEGQEAPWCKPAMCPWDAWLTSCWPGVPGTTRTR